MPWLWQTQARPHSVPLLRAVYVNSHFRTWTEMLTLIAAIQHWLKGNEDHVSKETKE